MGNISIQPSASISYKGIWLSGWGTVGFDKDDTKEFDLTVGYSIKGFSASITDYWFTEEPVISTMAQEIHRMCSKHK